MSSNSQVTLKALGLNTSDNELTAPAGSMHVASNVVITQNNIIEPRRGYKLYGDSFGSASDRLKQILEYKERIFRHYSSTLQYDTEELNSDDESVFQSLSASVNEVSTGLRIRSIEANGNLYFTSSTGVRKISVAAASDLSSSTEVTDAGGIKALDVHSRLAYTQGSSTGFLPTDSTVAYRTLWVTNDANKNSIAGTPSSRTVIYNPLQSMIVRDMNTVLQSLDNLNTAGSLITDGNYVSSLGLTLTATAGTILSNLESLCTKLDQDPGTLISTGQISAASVTSNICTVTVSDNIGLLGKLAVGDKIYLAGTWTDSAGTSIAGVQTVLTVPTTTTATSFTFAVTAANGGLTLSGHSVEQGWFRAIDAPDEPAVPATHTDLQNISDYLQNILTELQSSHNIRRIAINTGTVSVFPGDITTASVSGATTLTVNVNASSDLQDAIATTDLVYLNGTWNSTSPVSNLAGLQTVATVAATNFTATIPTTTNGAVTIDTTSSIDRILRFTSSLQTTYLSTLTLTTTANVYLKITVPPLVTTDYYYQVYRSSITTAATTDVLTDLIPGDEMRQVYEAYPTQAEIDAGTITVLDNTPESFFEGGAFLYTNQNSGEGILQANDVPPAAYDINSFKNVTFYANTRTRQRFDLSLLGLSDIISDYDAGGSPSISIINESVSNQYNFVSGVEQITQFTCGSVGNISTTAYVNINSAEDETPYYLWFYTSGSSVDPAPSGRTGIRVDVSALSTANQVAQRVSDVLMLYQDDFISSVSASVVTITNVNSGPATTPSIVTGLASPFAISVTTPGQGESTIKQVTSVSCVAGNNYVTSGTADYFTINTAFDRDRYYVWFNVSGGSMTDPALDNRTGVQINVSTSDTSTVVGTAIKTALNNLTNKFSASSSSNTITITNYYYGPARAATEVVANAGFTVSTTLTGALNVLLSDLESPSQAVEETAQSLVRVINKNESEQVSGFYLSGINDVPGLMLIEGKTLATPTFYVFASSALTGESFNPVISPEFTSLTNTAADPTVVTISNHGFTTNDEVLFTNSNSFPRLNGIHSVTVIDSNTFSVDEDILIAGTTGIVIKVSNAEDSDDEVKVNRVYFSKYLQPEAVPIVNYLDVGATDKSILRIFPTRDTLFVFKEDGLYRISGEVAPFSLNLFDSSCILIIPDSVDILNNTIYCWTKRGIVRLTESGVEPKPLSRVIDNLILPLNTSQYAAFVTATWGLCYQSDNAYYVYTINDPNDEVASICYRYSELTDSWTTFDKSETCGIVKSSDDKLYMGAGDTNYIEQERKDFTRTDYTDRELSKTIITGAVSNNEDGQTIALDLVNDCEVNDAVVQNQYTSVYDIHKLLNKLDIDSGIAPSYTIVSASWNSSTLVVSFSVSSNPSAFIEVGDSIIVSDVDPIGYNGTLVVSAVNSTTISASISTNPGTYLSGGELKYSYFNSLEQDPGANIRTALEDLAAKLVLDPGTVTKTYSTLIAEISATGASVAIGDPAIITQSAHGLQTGRYITITDATTVPVISGIYEVTRLSANTFSIEESITTAGTIDYETVITDVRDIQGCYNIITSTLSADTGPSFANYPTLSGTNPMEATVIDIDKSRKLLVLDKTLDWVVGPLLVYKQITSDIQYTPLSMEDPLTLKQYREAQLLFANKTFIGGTMTFASDLAPRKIEVEITGMGKGLFGNEAFGENYLGGNSHSPPFITYIPRQTSRARFLRVGHRHSGAREQYAILGVTITGRVISTRAYR